MEKGMIDKNINIEENSFGNTKPIIPQMPINTLGQNEPRVKPFATEICIAHVKDGIEKYNRDAYKKCEEQLLKIIAILYHAQVDIKVKDIIPVEKDDIYWYKIKERTLDLGETLRITYWVDDLG